MRIKLSELKKLVREGIDMIREDYEVPADDTVDLADPVILWNNTFDMNDQETMTKVANRRINLNEPDPADDDEVDRAVRSLMGPGKLTGEAKKKLRKRNKTDSNGCESPFAIDKYAKKRSRPKTDRPLSMREALPKGDKYPAKAGWQGERDDDEDKDEKRKRMRSQLKGKDNPMRGPVINRRKPKTSGGKTPANFAAAAKLRQKGAKVSEDKFPDKDGWQGELYRGDRGAGGGRKNAKGKKQKTPRQRARADEVAPKGWEGTVKAMKKDKKKGKTKVDNPWAMTNYMKNKGFKSHRTKSGKKKD